MCSDVPSLGCSVGEGWGDTNWSETVFVLRLDEGARYTGVYLLLQIRKLIQEKRGKGESALCSARLSCGPVLRNLPVLCLQTMRERGPCVLPMDKQHGYSQNALFRDSASSGLGLGLKQLWVDCKHPSPVTWPHVWPSLSAGGTGVLLNVDRVAELLEEMGYPSIQVRGLADSGWFLDNKQYRRSDCIDTINCAPTEAIRRGIRCPGMGSPAPMPKPYLVQRPGCG